MNKALLVCCLFGINNLYALKSTHFSFSPISISHTACTYLKHAAATTASMAMSGTLLYYFLLPAVTQTATAVGTAMVHETALLAEKAASHATPYGAGAFLIDFCMNELGIESRQANSRVYAAAAMLYLIRKQFFFGA